MTKIYGRLVSIKSERVTQVSTLKMNLSNVIQVNQWYDSEKKKKNVMHRKQQTKMPNFIRLLFFLGRVNVVVVFVLCI